jgi:hypothetical protein
MRQWYIPATSHGPGTWGMPRRFGMIPPLWQVPMLFSQVGMGLGRIGSPMTAMLGFGLNRYTLAFMNGMQRGQAQYARQQRDLMDMQADQLETHMQQELDDYNQVFREYGDPNDPKSVDPKKIPALKQALYAVAAKYQDQHMKNALDNSDIEGAIRQINYLDARHGDLKAGRASRSKEAKETKAEQEGAGWGDKKPADEKPHWPGYPDIKPPPAPTGPAGPAGPAGREESRGALADPGEEADARAEYRGQQWSKEGIPPEALARIQHRAANLRSAEDDALDPEKHATEQERYEALSKVDKSAADEADAVANYRIKVPYGREGMPPRIAALAKRLNPQFDQGAYQYIQEFRNPNSREGSTLQRSGSMAGAGETVLEAARVLIEKGKAEGKTAEEVLNQLPVWNSLDAWMSQKGKGEPEWTAFYQAYNSYVQEQVWVTRGGSGNEADIIRSLQAAPISNIRQVLATLSADSQVAVARIEQARKHWDQNTQGRFGPALGYDPETLKIIHGIGTLDSRDFTFGPDAPQSLRDIGLDGPGSPGMIERKQRHEQHERTRLGVPPEASEWKVDEGKTYYKLNGKWMTD